MSIDPKLLAGLPGGGNSRSPQGGPKRRSFRALTSLRGPLHEDDLEAKARERNTAEADAKDFDPKDLKRLKIRMTKMLKSLTQDEVEKMVKRSISQAKSQSNPKTLGLPHFEPKRWKEITAIMSIPIKNTEQIQKIWSSCPLPMDQTMGWGFVKFIEQSSREKELFFKTSLPFMQQLVLSLPKLFGNKKENVALMFMKTRGERQFTALQVAAMIACAFFCILNMEYRGFYEHGLPIDAASQFHNANMRVLLEIERSASFCKFRCIINYFAAIASEKTAKRRVIALVRYTEDLPSLNKNISLMALRASKKKLIDVKCCDGTLRKPTKADTLRVVPCGAFPGGHFIGEGNDKEELLVCEFMESYLMILFAEKCAPNDVVVVIGCQHHNEVRVINQGFGLEYVQPAKPIKDLCTGQPNRLATFFLLLSPQDVNFVDQYKPYVMQRELAKAFIGFNVPEKFFKHKVTRIETSNWGVGAHGGDLELKFALQWIAVTIAHPDRNIDYYSEGHPDAKNLPALIAMNEKTRLVVNQAWHMLLLMSSEDPKKRCSLVKFAEKLSVILKMMQSGVGSKAKMRNSKGMRMKSNRRQPAMETLPE